MTVYGAPLTGRNVQAGYLFQADSLFPWKTALDNIAIGIEVAGVAPRQARERATQWLARVGLGAFAARYPHMLSGGQRKRVGLAQVLIRDPKILLMDEPFGPLDAQTRQIMGNLLLDLWSADRKAVLFVTHDLEEAIALSDRVVIMSAGPAARVIGDWTVALPRPRDTARDQARQGVPRPPPRDLAHAQGRSAEGLRARRGRVRLQIAVDLGFSVAILRPRARQSRLREEDTVNRQMQNLSLAGALVVAACTGAFAADFTLTSSAFKDGTMLAQEERRRRQRAIRIASARTSRRRLPGPIRRPGPRAMRC